MKLSYIVAPEFQTLGITNIAVAEIFGIRVASTPPRLQELKDATLAAIMSLSDEDIRTDATLEGYRELVGSVGRSLKKFPPAAEKLLRQVRRTGVFPTVNNAVDAYNLAVTKHKLAIGVHDLDLIDTRVEFRLSGGGESFIPVGGDRPKVTQQGDYVYADARQVLAWLDSSDSEHVKVSNDTRNVLVVIQGTRRTTNDTNLLAASDACQQIVAFCGGEYTLYKVGPS